MTDFTVHSHLDKLEKSLNYKYTLPT